MVISKFAAIDIGSNSVRMLIANVLMNGEGPLFKKSALIRVPVRLGVNAFTDHKIPEVTIRHLEETMMGFRYLMRANEVLHYKGCATSALREAENGPEIVKRIRKTANVEIEIISGNLEAQLIFNSQEAALNKLHKNCLFVDVGGGSTEVTVFSKSQVVASKSFPVGTIRLLQDQVKKAEWQKMKDWVKETAADMKDFAIVGSGGNINRIAKLAQLKPGKALGTDELAEIVEDLKHHTFEERMKLYDLNPDRADVIVPAGEIFMSIIKWVGADRIYIPKIGLGDGIVREVYKEYLAGLKAEI